MICKALFKFKWLRLCYVIIWSIFVVLPYNYHSWYFCIIITILYCIIYDIKISKSFVFSTKALFILLMQLVNGAQFLNITCLSFLSAAVVATSAHFLTTVIVPFRSMYASLKSQRFDLSIVVWNLIWLSVLYVPRASTFTSTQFFVVNFDGLLLVLFSKFLIF